MLQATATAYTRHELDMVERVAYAEARKSFWAYRRLMNPSMLEGWWQYEVACELQRFYDDLLAQRRPILLLQSPPQHGKSTQIIDFIAWSNGQNPHWNTIFASYSDRLGIRANLRLQRAYDSKRYHSIFPNLRISQFNVVTMAGRHLRNHEIIEYIDRGGSFRNTTVAGPVTGEGLDLGVIDDPIKGRAEASSPTIREKTWNWLTDDFYSRFSNYAGMILIMTRWHTDDPAGRLMLGDYFSTDCIRHLRYPALAEVDEKYRHVGEPLFPEHKSLDFLVQRRKLMTQASWESVYQQNPFIPGGGIFPIHKFKITSEEIDRRDIEASIRYWDKAATEDGGNYTAGVLMHKLRDGTFLVEDCTAGQWAVHERESRILQTADIDGWKTDVWVEQEPGSGGKESAEATVRMLAGYTAFADKVTDSKSIRAEPYAAQVQGGNIKIKNGPWVRDFFNDHELFPNGPHKDRVDAAAGAFAKLTLGSTYDDTMQWVR